MGEAMMPLTLGLIAAGFLISLPMFVVLTGTSFVVLALSSSMPLSILTQRVFAGLESFPLMAIPFFVLAAAIMARGGLSDRLIDLIQSLVGHLPGGLGITVVLTCVLFGSITGSSASTIVAVGAILYPALIAAGYSERFAIGVITSSALIGMVIPPSNAMIVFGAVANVSIGALFMSGIGAGLLFASLYAGYCVAWAHWNDVPRRPRATLREVATALRNVAWGLGMPAIILGGIYGGLFTATEAAAVAVVYAAFVCMVVYRQLTFAELWSVCIEAGLITARILIMVGAASLFSWMLTITGLARSLVEPLATAQLSPTETMALVNLTALTSGMFIDVFSNILILTPILMPIVAQAGVGGVHFGAIMTVNVDIGNVTPPFGLNLFVASATFRRPYLTVVRAVLPWLALALVSLAITTYVPAVSMWLPSRLYP